MAASILNIAKANGKPKGDAERTLLAMWSAKTEIGVKATCATFSPEADVLVVGDDSGTVTAFDPKTGRIDAKMGVTYAKQTSDRKWQIEDNGRGTVMALRFNPANPKGIVRVGLSDGVVECYSTSTRSSVAVNVIEGTEVMALDYSSDGKYYAVGGADPPKDGGKSCAIRLYDDMTSKEIRQLTGDCVHPGHAGRITCIRFNGRTELASASMDGTIKLWSVGDKDPKESYPAQGAAGGSFHVVGKSVDFSSDGNYMLVGSARPERHLLIYDRRKQRLLSEVPWRRMKPAKSAAARNCARCHPPSRDRATPVTACA